MRHIGLALSGGGLRATFFHLGVIAAIREKGLLQKVTEIASVSGGSINGAHLAMNWAKYTSTDAGDFDTMADELIKLGNRDIRNRVLRRTPLQYMLIVPRLTRSHAWSTSGWLEHEYQNIFKDKKLSDLKGDGQGVPHLSILSTSLTTGQVVAFSSDGVYFFPEDPRGRESFSPETDTITLARAVAASSAFPPMFCPVPLAGKDLGFAEGTGQDHQLTDGGIFDNLGIVWLTKGSPLRKTAGLELLIVSNAGRPFGQCPSSKHTFGNVIGRNMRANDISSDRIAIHDTASVSSLGSTMGVISIRLGDRYEKDEPIGFNKLSPAQQLKVENTRTDLNRFDPSLVAMIVRHGYLLAKKELSKVLP
jgi:predicted acylesterase/phospholipase RssA